MKICIDIPDGFQPDEGDAFDAVHAALEHFEIPSLMKVLPANFDERLAFVIRISELKMWDYSNDTLEHIGEIEPPSEGYSDSHCSLMGLISEARELNETARRPVVRTDQGNEVAAAAFIQRASLMSTDELDDWYEAHVGYRLSEDDPSLVGKPEHAYLVAEAMCLHEHGPKGTYGDMCVMLEQLRTGGSDGRTDKYFPAPSGLLKRLSPLPGKVLESDFKKALQRLTYPYFELSKEQFDAVKGIAGDSDVLLFDGVTQVTFGESAGKFGLMPLHLPL